MEKIYEYLRKPKQEKSYEKVFEYDNSKLKSKLSADDEKRVEEQETEFEKNRLTKILVSKKFNKKISLEDAYWIINVWGGIGSFKKNEKNDNKIAKFLAKLETENLKLTKKEFGTISSLSKLSFFYDIEKYCIYDSRVIYTLNWIIFKSKESNLKYFPMPTGRNKIIANYPINSIIKFTLLEQDKTSFSDFYYSHKEAYRRYNELMRDLSKKIFQEEKYPFFAEMLLFGIADKYVFEDIKQEVIIKLKSW